MQNIIRAILLCTLLNTAWAETRNLTEDWTFAETGQQTEYILDWPLKQTSKGWEFTIRYPNGSPVIQSTLIDIKADPLFTQKNYTGEYRTYYSNGKLSRQGTRNANGNPTGSETEYREDGTPKKVIRYLPSTAYVNEKEYYPNGQLEYEGIDFDGEGFNEYKHYTRDGKLERKQFTRVENGLSKDIIENYDDNGNIKSWTEEYGDAPHLEITYDAQKNVLKKTVTGSDRYKSEQFSPQGELLDLTQYATGNGRFDKDGEQIQTTDDGEKTYSFYRNDQQEGEYKKIKGNKVIYHGYYHNDKPVGEWFTQNSPEENSLEFYRYGPNEKIEKIYSVGLDYIHYDDQGMPIATLPFKAGPRILPAPGAVWTYSSDGEYTADLQLLSVKKNTATYRLSDQKNGAEQEVTEVIDNYSTQEQRAAGKRVLNFPLTPGKEWRDSYQKTVSFTPEKGVKWQYAWRAQSNTRVAGVDKITVAGGTFDTLVITRNTSWQKSDPRVEGPSSWKPKCYSQTCSIKGYTREVMWYAPAIGRAVLKAVVMGGQQNILGIDARSMLKRSDSIISELTDYAPAPKANSATEDMAPATYYARTPASSQAFRKGFPMMANDSWEFFMGYHVVME
ncbi:toxin-antitoxin system YwqK family antitoxin [Affinibrenneria salicis]|nr:hypothetical protein [Affinibrenneria salicis]